MINITPGDTAILSLTATDGDGNPVDLTGASFQTQIKMNSLGQILTLPNNQHTADPDQTTNRGKFTLSLTQDNTEDLVPSFNKTIITQITIGGSVVYYHGVNALNVLSAVPLQ